MNKITRSLANKPTIRNFLDDVVETLIEEGHLSDRKYDDRVVCELSSRGGLCIRFTGEQKEFQINSPISNVGFVVFEETSVRVANEYKFRLLDKLQQTDTTPVNDLNYLKRNLRYVLAEIICETYPT